MGRPRNPPRPRLTLDDDRRLETQLKVKALELDKMLPEHILTFCYQIPPEFLNMEEDLLLGKLRKITNFNPPNTVEKLRSNFWIEYERVVDAGGLMNMDRVWAGACARGLFLGYLDSWKNMAWILCRPTEYLRQLETMYSYAMRRINELITHPFIKENKIDYKHAELVLKAANMLDMRLRGGYVQKNLNINKEHKTIEFTNNTGEKMLDLDTKLQALEEEAKRLASPPEPVDTIEHLTKITSDIKPEIIVVDIVDGNKE